MELDTFVYISCPGVPLSRNVRELLCCGVVTGIDDKRDGLGVSQFYIGKSIARRGTGVRKVGRRVVVDTRVPVGPINDNSTIYNFLGK